MSLHVFASLEVSPQAAAQAKAALRALAEATRQEPGCLRYELYELDGRPESLYVFEEYRNEAAVAFHRAAPHYRAFRELAAEILVSPVDVKVLKSTPT